MADSESIISLPASPIPRRGLLTGASALALALATSPMPCLAAAPTVVEASIVAPPAGPAVLDPVIALCERWLQLDAAAEAAFDRAGGAVEGDPVSTALWAEGYRLDAEAIAISAQINSTPAITVAGALAKLEVWARERRYDLDSCADDHVTALSALRDLRHLAGRSPGIA